MTHMSMIVDHGVYINILGNEHIDTLSIEFFVILM